MSAVEAVEPLPFIEGIASGEGPRWHDGRLWFSDGRSGQVCSAGDTGDVAVEAEIVHASGLGWLPDGTLVLSTLFEAKIHHIDTKGQLAATVDLTHRGFLRFRSNPTEASAPQRIRRTRPGKASRWSLRRRRGGAVGGLLRLG